MPYADPERQRQYQRERVARCRAEWFADKACVRCGSTSDLRLDHKDATLKVEHRIWSWSAERRKAELAKCQVLCQPCHVEKTLAGNENARGTQLGKLTEEQVRTIREMRANGVPLRTVVERLGIPKSTVSSVATRTTWQHLP